ncbi:class I SAM-dependent methyltransferase [Burkholderia dolosa]|nr:class I SAM-dependent methyltransferase [Burkholderia dolosa]MBR8316074.1 class I SAM-dependent methyltransferase [Burkholderia dolosa]
MDQVIEYFEANASPSKILDIPAGSGIFAQELERLGHFVVKADIHGIDGFVHANMDEPLPMKDGEFDAVTCLEGIEHLVNPVGLLQELVRVTAPGGTIVISTPNITNLHSRLQFLFTGTFFQFDARGARQTHGALIDRGHVSPFTPLQLSYVLGSFGCELKELRIDRAKRKALIPLYLAMKPFSLLWTQKIAKGTTPGTYPGVRCVRSLLTGFDVMFGRSQILVFQKATST